MSFLCWNDCNNLLLDLLQFWTTHTAIKKLVTVSVRLKLSCLYNNNFTYKSFHWLLSASSVCYPAMLLGALLVMMVTRPPACLHSLLNEVVPYRRQIVPSTISVEAWVQGSYVNDLLHFSFKPPHYVVKISVFSNSTEYSGCFKYICFATSEVVELGPDVH